MGASISAQIAGRLVDRLRQCGRPQVFTIWVHIFPDSGRPEIGDERHMYPLTTNSSAPTRNVHCFGFESAGALEIDKRRKRHASVSPKIETGGIIPVITES
jgi:hypothetical protein